MIMFNFRKSDPIAMKNLITQVQSKATSCASTDARKVYTIQQPINKILQIFFQIALIFMVIYLVHYSP